MGTPVILRLAGRYISRRLLQSVLFVLGVALGVAMVIAIDIANSSAFRAFNLSTETITGRATHQIIGGPSGLPSSIYRDVRLGLGIREAAPVVEEYVTAVELGGQPLLLLGVDPFAEPPFRSYLTTVNVEGDEQTAFEALNRFIAEPNTVLISQTIAERYGVQAGDMITLRPKGRDAQVRVIGTIQADDDVSAQAIETLILTDIATAQELVGQPDSITRIDLILPADTDLAPIRALLPTGAFMTTPDDENSAVRQMTAAFELNLQALSLLALVVGVFLIYNTVTFSVVQRRAIIGILRALGASKRQIFTLIIGEAALLGLIGVALGLGLGIIFGRFAVGIVAQTISDLYFAVDVQRVTVDPLTLLKGALIGIAASIGAAIVPSLDATRMPPVGTMRRSESEAGTLKLLPLITLAAVALCIAGAVLLSIPGESVVVSFMGLFAVVVGGALFTPALLVVFMGAASPVTERVFGVLGRMAPRAVARSLSRTSVAVAALTVAVSVIVGVSVMIASFRNTVSDWLDNTLGADIYISPTAVTETRITADIDRALVDVVANVDGVARVSAGRGVEVVAPDYPNLPPVNLAVADGEVTDRRGFVWLSVPREDYWQALQDGAIMVSEPFAFRRGITQENNQLTLLTDRGAQTFEIVGVYYDYGADQGTVFMVDRIYRQSWDDPFISTMAVFLEPGVDAAAALEAVRTALVGTDMQARSNAALRANVFQVFEQAFSITIALRLLATIVAFIGILSALLALQLEQTRQYGTMRAVGLTPGQLWRYTLLQTGLMGTTAGVLALPIGMVLAVVLIAVINVRSFGWTMNLTWTPAELLSAFAVAVIAALLAGVYPAYRLTQLVTARA
ncbi:MAG: FtsX-like permease family protein, partial [Chloroflexota bacterium]|nr:FtsX-like permease family protein [Chloroflexota bacterium]